MNQLDQLKQEISQMDDASREEASAVVHLLVQAGLDKFAYPKNENDPMNLSNEDVHLVPNGQTDEVEPQLPAKPAPIAAKVVPFDKNIVFFGFGCVAECVMPILLRHVKIDMHKVTVIDALDKTEVMKNWIDQGVRFVERRIMEDNFDATMAEFLHDGDLLIDLAYDIDCRTLLQYCRVHNILYVNTSVEEWDYTEGFDKRSPYDKSLYARHQEIDAEIAGWVDNKGTTAVLDHGANPGLISHFMKQGLLDLAKAKGKPSPVSLDSVGFSNLAKDLGVKVVLDTERDTQISNTPRQPGEFVNTWSVLGFMEEGCSPAELGWGTHETWMPENANIPEEGPKNQIFLSQPGLNTKVRGFVPHDPKSKIETTPEEVDAKNKEAGQRSVMISTNSEGDQIQGVLIRHGEAYTQSKYLTTPDGTSRPTTYYCYQPCDAAVASLQEVRGNDLRPLPKQRIMYDNEVISGSDALGVMIGGYDEDRVYWFGTILNIEDARDLAPLQNATSIQVAIGLVSAVCWAIDNPKRGVCRPEDLDTDYILNIARPYLGSVISNEYEWSPKKNYTNWYPECKEDDLDENNLWGFHNFLVHI